MAIRVCHVTSLHDADDGRIFRRYCKSLAKKYEVFLVAPNTETRVEDGVHIVGVSLPDINHRLKRWMSLGKLLPTLYEIDAEVYHFHDPELMKLGLKLKKKGKKIIFDSHEDVPMQFLSKGFIPKPLRKFASKCYTKYEARLLKQYTAVVSVTIHIVERLKNVNPNTYQITNYPQFENRSIDGRPWDRSICFAGLLSPFWMLKEIISILPEVNAKLYLAGYFATEDYLKELQSLSGWKNVDFYGTLPHDEILKIYNKSSIGIAIESYENPNAGFRVGSLGCTKIPDYMSSGLPIIVSNTEVWGGVVKKYECGLAIENPNDSNEIASAIQYLLDNPEKAKNMGENGLKAAKEEFNWEAQEKVLFDMYDGILNDKTNINKDE